jgi:hypothetical protein
VDTFSFFTRVRVIQNLSISRSSPAKGINYAQLGASEEALKEHQTNSKKPAPFCQVNELFAIF